MKCLNQCSQGTFLSSQMTCEPCYNSCTSCEGPSSTQCLSCQTGFFFLDGFCTNICPDNTTQNGSFCSNDSCANNCALCGQNKSYCLTCKTGYFFDNATKSCLNSSQCSGSFYYSAGECKMCDIACLTCEGNASNCTNCVNFYNQDKLLVLDNNTGVCLDECPIHYYGNKQLMNSTEPPFLSIIDYICKPCDATCLTCQDSGNTSCLSCNASNSTTQLFEYGTCVAKCSSNLINVNSSLCLENCTNSNCYKCSTGNTSQCIECSPLSYLINSQCYSEQSICNNNPHEYISSTNPYNCSNCDIKCKTCSNFSKNCLSCNLTDDFPFLYDNQCVTNCPAGFSPVYGDNMICKDFICTKPCKTCLYNQSTCYQCDEATPYLYNNYCYLNCPFGTLVDDTMEICVPDNKVDIWASWVVFCIFIIVAIYFILSLIFLKNTIAIGSSLICMLQITEFFSKMFIFGFLFKMQELAACVFSFINLMNNCVISMVFQMLYVGVLEIHIRSFSLFKSGNKKFYYFVLIGMLIFGINFTFAFSSGLFKFVKSEFETNFEYSRGLDRMMVFGFVFALMQFCVDCYILNKYNAEYDVFHLAYINLIMNVVIYAAWGIKKLLIYLEKSKKLINKKK